MNAEHDDEMAHVLSLLEPEEREALLEDEEEKNPALKLSATTLEITVGETAVLPIELTVGVHLDMRAGDRVTTTGQAVITLKEKTGRRATLLIETLGACQPRKIRIGAAAGAASGDHRTLEVGASVVLYLEERKFLSQDAGAGETVTARKNVSVAMEHKTGRKARLVFEVPASSEIATLLAL